MGDEQTCNQSHQNSGWVQAQTNCHWQNGACVARSRKCIMPNPVHCHKKEEADMREGIQPSDNLGRKECLSVTEKRPGIFAPNYYNGTWHANTTEDGECRGGESNGGEECTLAEE